MRVERGYWTFIIFLLINTIIAIIYMLVGVLRKKDRRRLYLTRGVVMFCAPGVGALLFIFGWLFYRIFFHKEVDLSDVIFSKERTRELIRTNEEQERNFVPLEEAIEISDTGELRNLMLGVAQNDYSHSLSSIYAALNSEDTETAHYAASVLQDALNDFRNLVQKEYNEIMANTQNLEQKVWLQRVEELLSYMDQVLVQHVLSNVEQEKFAVMMDAIMEKMYEHVKDEITSTEYEEVSLCLLDIKHFEDCEKWCDRAMDQYPEELASYTARIKLYFNSNEKDKFFRTLEDVKHSSVIIDKETLELIRTFQ